MSYENPQLVGNEIWMNGLHVGTVFDSPGFQHAEFRDWLASLSDIQSVQDAAVAGDRSSRVGSDAASKVDTLGIC